MRYFKSLLMALLVGVLPVRAGTRNMRIDNVTGEVTMTVDFTGSTEYQGVSLTKDKWDATTAPTINEDSGDGYAVGSLWVDVTGNVSYILVDASVGAADWNQIDDNSGEANTASNAGTGVSVFYQKTVLDLELNGIKSENDRLTVTLDGASHDIELTVNEGNILVQNLGGTSLLETKGGTGTSTYTTGDILFSDAGNSLAKLAKGTVGEVLTETDAIPDWQDPGWYSLTEDVHWNDDPVTSSTITTIADLTSVIIVGTPIKYTMGGGAVAPGTYYGVVTAMAANLITLAGVPMEVDDGDLTALWIGRPERVIQVDLFVTGAYGDGADATLLATDMSTYFKWGGAEAYLVMYECIHLTVDTGTEPKINVDVDGASVSTADSGNGVQLGATATWVANSAVAIDSATYRIDRGDSVEANCKVGGGTGDAAELTITCFFVYK